MADAQSVIQRLDSKISDQIHRSENAKKTTIGIYVVLLIVVVGYFTFLIGMVKEFSTPEALSEVAVGYAVEEIPQAREELASYIVDNADDYMNDFIDKGLEQIPRIRAEVQRVAVREVDTQLRLADQALNDFLDYAYANNGEMIRPYVQQLDEAETMEEIEEILYTLIKEPFDHQQLKVELETYGMALQNLADRLQYLREADDLSEIEQLEKEVIVVLREISERSG